jgi:serine/threonine-protein kinase
LAMAPKRLAIGFHQPVSLTVCPCQHLDVFSTLGLGDIMTESPQDSDSGEPISQICAEFTSSWDTALKGVGDPPQIELFLTRASKADRPELQRELDQIQQSFGKQTPRHNIWQGGTVDQNAVTPCPEGLATIDEIRKVGGNLPSLDPAATLDHDSQEAASRESPVERNLANARFSLEDEGAPSAKASGPSVNGYEIVGELGRGGMGVVYKARQIGLNRWVALKMVLSAAHATQHQLNRFLTEAKAVADLQHPNIVQIYENGEHDGLPFFSLEFVGGGSLDAKIHRKPQPPHEAAHMVETLAEAMQYAHEHGVIHRDLKPANILLTVDGIPKITDFGLAKRLAEDTCQTKAGTLMGTPSYMAPEQARGEIQNVGAPADIYTLGAILYELVTGRPPFQAATVLETVKQVTNDEPVPPSRLQPHVPRDLETICLKCLQKDPVQRYGSAGFLAEDLRRFLSDEPILARPISTFERLTRWCRRNPRVAALLGTVGLLLIVVACGSLAFAYRINEEKARTLEYAKSEEKARLEADKAADEARKAQAVASEQADNAWKTIYEVVTALDEKLRTLPAMGKLRLNLLEMVMKRLDKISKDSTNAGKVDRTLGLAFQKMGRYCEEMGRTPEQIRFVERALGIFNRLINEYPEEDWNKFDAAICYDDLGEIGREIEPDPAKLFANYDKALELRKDLTTHVRNPEITPLKRFRALAVSYVKSAALSLEVGDPIRALGYAQKALEASEQTVALDPNQTADRLELYSSAHFLIGKAQSQLGAEDEARKHLQKCVELRQEWKDLLKLNSDPKKELGRAYEALGDLEMESGHAPAALDYYSKAHDIFEGMVQKDRDQLELQWYLSNMEYHLGVVKQVLGDPKAAEKYFASCLKTRELLLKSDDKNVQRKIELLLVQARMGLHQQAALAADKVVEFAPTHPGKLFQAACGFALCLQAVDSNEKKKSTPPGSEPLQITYREKALAILHQAIDYGFKDRVALRKCPDLASLESLDQYKKLLNQFARR